MSERAYRPGGWGLARTDLGTGAPEVSSPVARPTARNRQIRPNRGVPSSRAVVGGLLMAVAAVGVLVALQKAETSPSDRVVVLVRDVAAGEVIRPQDVRLEAADLPSGFDAAFESIDDVAGLVALAPMAQGDLVQDSAVSAVGRAGLHEVAITLPREQVAIGRLKRGERIDAYVTADTTTRSVVRGAEVVQVATGDGGRSLTAERVVSLVVGLPSAEDVAALVHALRTGDVTVVRSTMAGTSPEVIVHPVPTGRDEDGEAPEAGRG